MDKLHSLDSKMVLLLLALAAGLLGGTVSASGDLALTLMLSFGLLGLLIVSSRISIVYFVIIGGLIVTGVAQLYVPGARYVRYLVPALTYALVAYGILDRIASASKDHGRLSGVTVALIMFTIIAVASALINFSGVASFANGMKNYFQMAGLLVGLLLIDWKRRDLAGIPPLLGIIALIQLPFALHQLLFLVPARYGLGGGVVAVDIIGGTFGGSRFGGGANAILALYQITVCATLLALSKYGRIRQWQLLLALALLLSPMLVNGAKVIMLYVPLAFLIVFYKDAAAQPLRFIGMSLVLVVVFAVLLSSFTGGKISDKVQTPGDLVSWIIERQTASIDERGADYSGLSRWTALTFWAQEHRRANPAHILIGHGPGASRVQSGGFDLVDSLAENKYGGLSIGQTAVSALLWEVGVLGLACIFYALFHGFRLAGKLARFHRHRNLDQAAVFQGLQAGVALMALSLFHKDFLVFNLPFQTLFTLVLGYLVVSRRHMRELEAAEAARAVGA